MSKTADLVESIEQKIPLSAAIKAAFSEVDRALFVPRYYRQVGASWILQETGSAVYKDMPLTTHITNKRPSSSSSMPSVMVAMLEALDVQPAQQVLEIGTGTGYNAALLAYLVGEGGQVVSVDIDERVVRQAREHLQEAGVETVICQQHNGIEGYAPGAPYHRLIVTGGFRHLPQAWIRQLSPSGVLVGNLLGALSSVLIRLEKDGSDEIRGKLLPHGAFFMELHDEAFPSIHVPRWSEYDRLPVRHIQADQQIIAALDDQAFLFFLQGQYPSLELHVRALGTPERFQTYRTFIEPASHASVLVRADGTVEAREHVWEEIKRHWECYVAMGLPTREEYTLSLEQGKLVARYKAKCWEVCLARVR